MGSQKNTILRLQEKKHQTTHQCIAWKANSNPVSSPNFRVSCCLFQSRTSQQRRLNSMTIMHSWRAILLLVRLNRSEAIGLENNGRSTIERDKERLIFQLSKRFMTAVLVIHYSRASI